ncbi:MAG: hypothetical protein FWD17_19640, partial [Polyangiaceae bacterium]|nr:hypothetical protein [Polyangiaceae bacterium]
MPKPPSQHRAPSFARQTSPPASDTELSTSRRRLPRGVPARWLDRLLIAATDLPLAAGPRPVVEAVLDAVAGILPAYAVGVSWIPASGSSRRERVTMYRVPSLQANAVHDAVRTPASRGGPVDPTRLFGEWAHEYIVPLAGDALGAQGSTLHVASNDDELDPASPVAHLALRAAVVLGRALPHAHTSAATSSWPGKQRAREFEKRMIQAEKLATFGQLAAGVVHELNNPLTSIVAYSEYLIRRASEPAGIRGSDDVERLRRIHESAHRMLRFTRDLVSYTRPSSETPGPVVLHGVLDQAVAFCEHVLSASGVRVERSYA